jgi:hypothetical protein
LISDRDNLDPKMVHDRVDPDPDVVFNRGALDLEVVRIRGNPATEMACGRDVLAWIVI